jgi:drug/metabolite transporter (DMT)-like permease
VAVVIWPINRLAMKKDIRTEQLGLMISISAFVLSLLLAIFTQKSIISFPGSFLGIFNGVAYAVGFCLIICHCLKIGPSGSTTAINNLGVIFPVILSIAFSIKVHPLHLLPVVGVLSTIVSLILLALPNKIDSGLVLKKWRFFVFLGWMFTGMSLSMQYLASYFDSKNSLSFVISGYFTSSVLLLIISIHKKSMKIPKIGMICGTATGIGQVITIILLFYITQYIPGYVVFPMMQILPIIVMIILGNFLFDEKIRRVGLIALVFSIVGITLMYI